MTGKSNGEVFLCRFVWVLLKLMLGPLHSTIFSSGVTREYVLKELSVYLPVAERLKVIHLDLPDYYVFCKTNIIVN